MTGNIDKNNSTLCRSACAIVFILFVFTYLYCFQADLLFMVQHVLSGGTTHYNRTIGAVIITVVLYIVHVGATRLGGFGGSCYALTYFPSLLLLTALTGVNSNFTDNPFYGFWAWLTPLLLVVYVVAALYLKSGKFSGTRNAIDNTLAGELWKNLLTLSCMFILVGLCGNSDDVFHYRLRMESLISSGNFSKALEVGDKSDDTDAGLTMLRIYALSQEKQLGERLFEYPVTGGSAALLPDGKNVKCLFYPDNKIMRALSIRRKGVMKPMEYLKYVERNGLGMRPVTDYLLCGYLLDKDLDGFVNEIRHKYNLGSPSLPKHYREALTLYTHLRANPVLVFHSEVMDADYADFQKLEASYRDKAERESYVRDTYGDTYWFYYFYK